MNKIKRMYEALRSEEEGRHVISGFIGCTITMVLNIVLDKVLPMGSTADQVTFWLTFGCFQCCFVYTWVWASKGLFRHYEEDDE